VNGLSVVKGNDPERSVLRIRHQAPSMLGCFWLTTSRT